MKNVYKTAEVAKLFDIPIATLHYWESQDLFTIRRDPRNGYRYFDMSDILNIWEIVLYRELDMPIRDIKQIMDSDQLSNLENVYAEHKKHVQERISVLQRIQARITKQQDAVREVKRLSGRAPFFSRPDFDICARDPLEIDTMLASLLHSYDCGLLSNLNGDLVRIHCLKPGDSREPLWTIGPKDEHYVEFLLKVNLDDMQDNNLSQIKSQLAQQKLEPGIMVARFLLVLGERGHRYEYYRAWLSVKP